MKKYYIRELSNTDDGITYSSQVEEALAIVTNLLNSNEPVEIINLSTNQKYMLLLTKEVNY